MTTLEKTREARKTLRIALVQLEREHEDAGRKMEAVRVANLAMDIERVRVSKNTIERSDLVELVRLIIDMASVSRN